MKYAFAASAVLAAGAVAQSDLTCAGTGVTVAATAVEYPVYISTYISAATVFNINGNANITINNAPTTLEIYTTGTSTVYATVTDTTTTTALAAATPTPTATTVDEPIILAINNAALKHKRQAGASGFLGGSAGVAATCGEAVVLSLTEGSLFVNSTGEQFSTTPGVTQMDFMAGTSVGSITTTFGLNNGFVWDNSAFVNGSATFCLSAGGVVQGLFGNSTPVDCTSISFTAILASSCDNTTSTSSASSSSMTSSASVNATSASIASVSASSVSSSISSVSASLSSAISSIESSASSAAANATSAASSVSAAVSSIESSASAAASSAESSASAAASSATSTVDTTSVQVSFTSPTAAAKNKRQTGTTEYLMADGTFTEDATLAATFDLVDGQFFSAGVQFSTDSTTDYAVFAASDDVGDITNTFDLSSGALMWTNETFSIDDANTVVFAISASTLYAAFQTIPPGATTVGLTASVVDSSTVIASDSATSVSSTTSAETSAASSATTAASTTAASTTSSSSSASISSSASSSSSSSASGAIASATSALNSTLKAKRYNGMARLHQRN